MDQLSRRKFIERAGVTAAATGGLWATSEIVASPTVFAGSSCLLSASTYDSGAFLGPEWGRTTWPVSGSFPAVSLTWSTAAIGSPVTPTPGAGNGTITTPAIQNVGVPNVRVFYFDLQTANSGRGYAVTFTFSVPVHNVTFRVYDIDTRTNSGQNYRDRVSVTANAGVTVSGTAPGGSPSGNGTAANPFIGTATSNSNPNASYGDYTLTGAVTSFTLSYTNNIARGTGTRMIIGIGDLYFCR